MNMFDSSVKVPFLIAYPPLVPAGTVCKDMVSAYDFFPTLLDLLGLIRRRAARLPGHSFLPCLRGESLPGGKLSSEEIIEKVSPSVVAITTYVNYQNYQAEGMGSGSSSARTATS